MEKEVKDKNTSKKTTKKPKTTTSAKLDELIVTVNTGGGSELICETGRTVMTLLMQEDGKVMSSFLGDYNLEIIKTLERVNKLYFKGLYKELFKKPKREAKKTTKLKKQEAQTASAETKETEISDEHAQDLARRGAEKAQSKQPKSSDKK